MFSLRRPDVSSSDDDGPESPASDSDDDAQSSGSRSRSHLRNVSKRSLYPHQYVKRMSLIGTKPKTEDPGTTARRFFHSSAVWDPALRTVVVRDGGAFNGYYGNSGLNELGRFGGSNGIIQDQIPNGHDMDVDIDSELRDNGSQVDAISIGS